MRLKQEHNNIAHFKAGAWMENLMQAVYDFVESRQHESYWQLDTSLSGGPQTVGEVYDSVLGIARIALSEIGVNKVDHRFLTPALKGVGRKK